MSISTPKLGAVLTALALVFTMTACGADSATDDGKDSTAPTTDSEGGADYDGEFRDGDVPGSDPNDAWEKDNDLPEEPGDGAALDKQIEHELLTATFEFTRELDKDAAVECPKPSSDGGDIDCETTYFGQKFDWKVSVSGGSVVASYEYESDKRVLSRSFVESTLRFEAETEKVACDIEEYQLVNPEDVEPAKCYSQDGDTTTEWELSIGGYGDATFYEK
ncbi:MAG: hypothetical protein ACRD0P_09940 [Stackebrandtia sp.]